MRRSPISRSPMPIRASAIIDVLMKAVREAGRLEVFIEGE